MNLKSIVKSILVIFLLTVFPHLLSAELTVADQDYFMTSATASLRVGNTIYVTSNDYMNIYDVTNPDDVEWVSQIPMQRDFSRVELFQGKLYLGEYTGEIHSFSLTDAQNPVDEGSLQFTGSEFHFVDTLLVVTHPVNGVRVLNANSLPAISEIVSFQRLPEESAEYTYHDATVISPYLLVSRGENIFEGGELVSTEDSLYVFRMEEDGELQLVSRNLFGMGKIQVAGQFFARNSTQYRRIWELAEDGSIRLVNQHWQEQNESFWLSPDSMLYVAIDGFSSGLIRQFQVRDNGIINLGERTYNSDAFAIRGLWENGMMISGDDLMFVTLDPENGSIGDVQYTQPLNPHISGINAGSEHVLLHHGFSMPSVLTLDEGMISEHEVYESPEEGNTQQLAIEEPYFLWHVNSPSAIYLYSIGEEGLSLQATVPNSGSGAMDIGLGKAWFAGSQSLYWFSLDEPQSVETFDAGSRYTSITVAGSMLFCDKPTSIDVYEPVASTSSIQLVGSIDAPMFHEMLVSQSGNLLVLFDTELGTARLVDIRDITSPNAGAEIDIASTIVKAELVDELLLVVTLSDCSVRVYNISDINHPFLRMEDETFHPLTGLAWNGDVLVATDGSMVTTYDITSLLEVEEAVDAIPTDFSLMDPWPNPFNASVTIPFYLPASRRVSVRAVNLLGQVVWNMDMGTLPQGTHRAVWDGKSASASSGVYLLQVNADGVTATRRVTLLK